MKELLEYRKHLIARLVSASQEFRDACLTVSDPHARIGEGWSTHQIAAHTRDVHKMVYGLRAERTAKEDDPEFQNFDGDTYMTKHYSTEESLGELLNNLVKDVETFSEMLTALPAESWSRASRHATFGGGFTLQTWVERDLAHIEEHLDTVKKGL